MKKKFFTICSLSIIFLLPSIFYAAAEPGGGDVPEYAVREPEPTREEQNYLMGLSKPKFLTLNLAIGQAEQYELEFGIRFTCYFRETAENFNIGLIFGVNYLYAWQGKNQSAPADSPSPSKRHYLSLNSMLAFYIYGFHLAVGIDYNVKFKGPDSDEVFLNTIFYKKSYFSLDIEIGYLFMPKNNRFTILLSGIIKAQLGGGSYQNQFATHSDSHVKGGVILFRVQIGLFLF
jgi:hypothetical protein